MGAVMENYYIKIDLQLFSQEKTEKATPKKRFESRKKGQVAKSQELPSSFLFLFVFASFLALGKYFSSRFDPLFKDFFTNMLLMEVTIPNIMELGTEILIDIVLLLAPIFILVIIVGVAGNVVQIGFLLTGETMKPKLEKINPISGFKRIFSMRSLVEFLKSILKFTLIGIIVYRFIVGELDTIKSLVYVPLAETFQYIVSVVIRLGITVGALFIVLAILDYMYQKYEHEKSIKMSKQDIKDEYKKMEGDPLIKGKIKERQMKMAIARMMQEVPNADVVITNPTHFAVALKYDPNEMDAPKVIAKGMDHVALKIREVAKEHGVVTMENKLLARALYSQAEIGDFVPADLFQAVAEVLAYVYKLKGKRTKANKKVANK